MSDCVKRIVEKSNGRIKTGEAKELVRLVDKRIKRYVKNGVDRQDAIAKVVQERAELVAENAAKERANMANNLLIQKRLEAKVDGIIGEGASATDALLAELESLNSPYKGAKDSIEYMKEGVKATYLSKLFTDLDKEGLTQLFNTKTLQEFIGRELWALSENMPRATQSDEAYKIAKIIHDIKDMQRLRMNEAGSDIEKVAGYIMPQRHDIYSMHKDGKETWISFMRPLLDEDRSFGGNYDDFDKALSAAYDAMISGTRLNDPTRQSEKLFQFSGPANLAKKLSQSRQLHFKDFDSWKKWNETYGVKDLNEGVLDSVEYDASNIALLERYGTQPETQLKALLTTTKERHRSNIAKKGERSIDRKVNDAIAVATGTARMVDNPRLAQYGATARAYNNITMLGGAVISSVTDIPVKALEYNYQGQNWLTSTTRALSDTMELFTKKEDVDRFMSMIGVYSETRISDVGARFSTQDDLGQKMSKVQRLFFKLNGLSRWTDRHKYAMYRAMSHDLGRLKAVDFDNLDQATRRLFDSYNIGKTEWDVARKAIQTLEDDGRAYLMPEFITDTRIKEKFTGYFLDRTNQGVITPQAREQRILSFGTQKGTPIGEFTRLVMQFKSFPVAVVTKVWGRALYGKGKADIPAMVYLALMSTTFGYMAGMAKDTLKNRTPKDPRKLETIYASFAQGGGLGIMGDILLADAGYGKSLTDIIAGPTASRVGDVFKVYSAAIRGDMSESQAARLGISLVPGNNLPYVAAGLNNIMQQYVYEELNPGYTRRMESNMKKAYNQEILFK